MAISQISVNTNNTIGKVVVIDGNNLIVRIDRGVAGRGVTDVEPIEIDGSLYLVFTFSDGTTETVGPVGTIQYIGQAPIVVTGSTISLSTVPVNLGGTGATTASGARTNLGLGTIATQNANAVSITGGTITGITDLAVADGGTGASTAAGAMVNLLPSYTGNANKRLSLDGTATGLEWVTDVGGTVTSVDVSGGTTGLSFTGGPITTSGTITLSGTLDVDNGGTGATTAAGARTNLNAADQAITISAGTGLSGGGDLSANRTLNIANTTVTAGAYGAASKTLTATVNAQGQLTALADTPIAIANTQISGLGTMSTQDANAVAITGGSITGITDLAVADGGTGASDASGARTNLGAAASAITISAGTGLSGGGDLTANRTLSIANTAVTAGAYGSASNTLTATVNAQGQLTALAATPIAISNTQVSGLGTMSTQNSNSVTITGGSITGITDLAIADGGTGASNAADARSNLGLGTAAVLNAGVALGVATLDAGGTVPLSQIPASIQGGVSYQGAWNASTNTPTLTSSVGTKGHYYVVSVAGNTNLNGVTDWLVGDWAIYNGTAWEKIDNTDQVASVNGYTGVVVLNAADVGAPPTTRTISAGTGLTGGGDLSTNRTISIANTTVSAASYGTASAVPTFTVNGQGQLTAASDVTIAIANTQVSGLGTMSTQNANNVTITGGSITGITDLAIADGGTGASTAGGALTNLGAIGSITSSDGSIVVVPSGTSVDLAVSAASPASTLLTQVRNTTGATLAKGTVVYISGATGQISTVSKAIATGDTTSAQTLGMITANLANNTNGYVTVFGLIQNIDTSAYTDGAQLYLSGTVAGGVTTTKPSAPTHLVYVGIVEYAHPTQGKILVKVQNGYELDEIHDVSIVSPVTGQTLVYNSSTDLWVNNTVSLTAGVNGTLPIANGGTGQTSANAAFNALAPSQTGNSGKYLTTDGTDTSWASNPLGTVTSVGGTGTVSGISLSGTVTTSGNLTLGGALDLSAYNGAGAFTTLSASSTVTLSGGTANGVTYLNGSKVLTSGSALSFDGTNLGVGIASAATRLHAVGDNVAARGQASLQTSTASNFAQLTFYDRTTLGAQIYQGYQATAGVGDLTIQTSNTSSSLVFGTNSTEGLRLTSTSLYTASGINVGIGLSNPAYKLDINGNVNIGSTSSVDTALFVKSSTVTGLVGAQSNYSAWSSGGLTTAMNIGTTTNNGISFGTNNIGRLNLDSAGNLGLGVTPIGWSGNVLCLQGDSALAFQGANGLITANAYYSGGWKYTTTGAASYYYQIGGAHQWTTAASGTAGNAISFTQAMTLDASGNLLVGGTTNTGGLKIMATDGTVQTGFLPYASNSVAYAGTWTNHAFAFTTNGTERARIDSSGNMLIGTTSAYGTGTTIIPAGLVFVSRNADVSGVFDRSGSSNGDAVQFRYNGNTVGSVSVTSTLTSYNVTSDYRLKTVIGVVTGHGERLDALEPIEYEWKSNGSRSRGFLAHKFQEVYAQSVNGTKDAVDADGNPVYQSMQASTSEVIADLVAEIQSLRQRVAQLETN